MKSDPAWEQEKRIEREDSGSELHKTQKLIGALQRSVQSLRAFCHLARIKWSLVSSKIILLPSGLGYPSLYLTYGKSRHKAVLKMKWEAYNKEPSCQRDTNFPQRAAAE